MPENKKTRLRKGYTRVVVNEDMIAVSKQVLDDLVGMVADQQIIIYTLEEQIRELENE